MKKVAIYARVSLDEKFDDRRYQEPENQLEPLRKWANDLEAEVFAEYVDRGSGANANRPELKRMLHDAMLRRFDTILIWKFDRLTREPMFVATGRIQKLKQRGVAVKSMTENWLDTSEDNPVGELVLSILLWAGNLERQKISERTKAGIQRRRNIGQWKGGRPKKGGAVSDRGKQ